MKIYTRTKKFNRNTGKPEMAKVFDHIRCDYTGDRMCDEDSEDTHMGYCSYVIEYGSSDPCFGASGDEFEFGQKHNVNMFQFLSDPYDFVDGLQNEEGYAFLNMMKEAIKNLHNEKSPWHNCFSFDGMCRTARILTATKLIEDGIIESWQLSPDED